jgi:DNA modification methylase
VTIHYRDDWLTVMLGDCREVMASMEPESVHCVVTSPPYWGLRDYGTATWLGGDEACDHRMKNPETAQRTSTLGSNGTGLSIDNAAYQHGKAYKDTCRKCGATRQDSQLGLEPTPEAYVESMVAVFREVRRVLRSDGTVWLNLGDSYASSTGQQTITPQTAYKTGRAGGDARGPARKTLDYEKSDAGFRDYGRLIPLGLGA